MVNFRYIYSKLNNDEYSDYDLNKFIKKLKQEAYENDNLQIHKLLATIYIIQGNYYKAKGEYLYIIKEYNQASGYFGLFKINILEGNFDNLDYYLKKYITHIDYKNFKSNNFGINLYKGLVSVYNSLSKFEEPNFEFKYENNILGCQILNSEMQNQYKECIKYLNEKNYTEALNCLIRCDEIKKENKITCNFYTAADLLKQIIKINFMVLPTNNEIIDECKNQNDLDNYIVYLDKEMSERKYTIEPYLHAAYYLIENNYFEKAREVLEKCSEYDVINKYKIIIRYLYGIMKNREEENDFEVQPYLYYSYLYQSDEDNPNHYIDSLYYLHEGLEKTKANIFNYFLGLTYYNLTDYEKAKIYFTEYLKNGGGKNRTLITYGKLFHINYFSSPRYEKKANKKTKEFYKLSDEFKQILEFYRKDCNDINFLNWEENFYIKNIVTRLDNLTDFDNFDFHKKKEVPKLEKEMIFPKEYLEKDTSKD